MNQKKCLPFVHLLGIRAESETGQRSENEPGKTSRTSKTLHSAPASQSVAAQIVEAGKKRRGEIQAEAETHGPAYQILAAGRKRRGEALAAASGKQPSSASKSIADQIVAAAAKARGE